jgi:hypothetical protein
MEQLQRSCDHADSYPLNLVYPSTYHDSLNDYFNQLSTREKDLFRDEESASVDFWELDTASGSVTYITESAQLC